MPVEWTGLELVSLLSDGYALRVLQAIEDEPLTASQIVRRTKLPPAACYRRLRSLAQAGLVGEEGSVPSRNGKPARRYRALVSRVEVVFDAGALRVNYGLRDGGTREIVLRLPIENP